MDSVGGKTTNRCSIVLACNILAFRDAMRRLLEREPDFVIIAEAEKPDELAGALRRSRPAILLCYFSPTDERVVSGLLNVATASARTRTVALVQSEFERRQLLRKAFVADALVLRDVTMAEIVRVIRNTRRPKRGDLVRGNGRAGTGAPDLTPREQQVVSMLAQGLRPREMAAHLNISESTVHICVDRLLEKYGVSRRLDPVLDSFLLYSTPQQSQSVQGSYD